MEKEFNTAEIALKIFSCIQSLNKKFGLNYIASVLTGAKTQKIQNYGHQNLETYGTLKDYSQAQVKEWMIELIEQGYLYQTKGEYPVIILKEKSNLVGLGELVNLKEPDPNLASKSWAEKGESIEKTVELFQQGKTVAEIANERNLAQTTILSHLAQAYQTGKDLNIDQFVEADKEKAIKDAFQKIGTQFLSPVKKELGVAYTWEELKLVRAKLLKAQPIYSSPK